MSKSNYNNTKNLIKPILTLLIAASLMLQGQAQISTTVQDSLLYPGIQQQAKSMRFYQVKLTNKSYQPLNQYVAISVDAEDSSSDPDLFISKTNQYPTNTSNSDQYCVKKGSEICFMPRNSIKVNETLYFGIQCITNCKYSLKVHLVNITNITSNWVNQTRLDGRQLRVMNFTIPASSQDGFTQSIFFQVDTFSTQTPIKLLMSTNSDLSFLIERDEDLVTDSGKAIRFNQEDPGWCINCQVYFVVSTEVSSLYMLTGRSSARNELMTDQIPLNRQLNALRGECFGYNIRQSYNDVVLTSSQFQGEANFNIQYRNTITNAVSNQVIISSDSSSQNQIIIRSADRMRFGPSTGLIYVCPSPIVDSSVVFSGIQQYSMNRFVLNDNTLTTFILDSKDFVYFVYGSYQLSQQQQITISVQSISNFTVPRIIYRICNSAVPDECTLTDSLAMTLTSANNMTLLNGTIDSNTQTRIGVINHNPQACPFPMACYYLISIYNPENSGPMKVNLKLSINNQNPLPIQLFQQYSNAVAQNEYHYFQVSISPLNAQLIQTNQLIITLTYFNGRADLYLSSTNRNPNSNNFEIVSRSLYKDNTIVYNVTGRNLMQNPIFIGVYGNVYTQYSLKIDADYDPLYPTKNQTIQPIMPSYNSTANTSSNVSKLVLTDKTDGQTVQFLQNRSEYIFVYPVDDSLLRSPRDLTRSLVILNQQVSLTNATATIQYNVTYKNKTWINQTRSYFTLNNTDDNKFEPGTNITIMVKVLLKATTVLVKGKNTTSINPSAQYQFRAVSITNMNNVEIVETNVNSQYENFLVSGTMSFKQNLIDINSDYTFALYNYYGIGQMVFNIGSLPNPDDENSYQIKTENPESQESISIQADKKWRNNAKSECTNSSYSSKGGNDLCAMYVVVKCNDLCMINFTVTQTYTGKQMDPPVPLRSINALRGQVARNKSMYYYIPYVKKNTQDIVLALSKQNNDSILVARIISNAWTSYYNWTYPTLTSNDFISQTSNSNYEIIELSNATLNSKCLTVNHSCAIIIGVFGNAPQNLSNSTYSLTYFNQSNRLSNITLFNKTIDTAGQYDYYWLLVNSKNAKNEFLMWNYLITLGLNSNNQEIDLYASTILSRNGIRYPSSLDFDFKGEKQGPDVISISSNDSFFTSQRNSTGSRILFIFGIKSLTNDTTYSLMNWGPNAIDNQVYNFTDVPLSISSNYTFQTRQTREGQYKIFRYLNYGTRDVQVNITCTDGGVYVLANIQPYFSSAKNAYMNVPIFNETSLIKPISILKGKFSVIKIEQSTDQTGLACQFCWQYFAVFQNASATNQVSSVSVRISEIQDGGQFVSVLPINQQITEVIALSGSAIQKKFILNSKQSFIVNMTSSRAFKAYIGRYTKYTNEIDANTILCSVSGTGTQLITIKESDPRFMIGTTYYLTVIAQANLIGVDIKISQESTIQILRNNSVILDQMWTKNDFVKQYYYIPPAYVTNYTVTLNVRSRTPGFAPNIYIQKNDFVNVSINNSLAVYPSMVNYTSRFEKPFYQAFNQTTIAQFNGTSTNLSVVQLVPTQVAYNVTTNYTYYNATLKKNVTVQNITTQWKTQMVNKTFVILNQTYYTIAIYWNNFGLTDIQKAEFEISATITPLPRVLKSQVPSFIDQIYQRSSYIQSKLIKNLDPLYDDEIAFDQEQQVNKYDVLLQ